MKEIAKVCLTGIFPLHNLLPALRASKVDETSEKSLFDTHLSTSQIAPRNNNTTTHHEPQPLTSNHP
jgi:hypothetical protein